MSLKGVLRSQAEKTYQDIRKTIKKRVLLQHDSYGQTCGPFNILDVGALFQCSLDDPLHAGNICERVYIFQAYVLYQRRL